MPLPHCKKIQKRRVRIVDPGELIVNLLAVTVRFGTLRVCEISLVWLYTSVKWPAQVPSTGVNMSILARLQRIVRAEFNAASSALDDALTNDGRTWSTSLVARAPADLRRERAQAYDWLSAIEVDAAAALQTGDSVRARALLQHAAYAESVLAGGKSVSESGAWPVSSKQVAPVSAPAQTMTLPRNPYGVASPAIRVRQAPPFAGHTTNHTATVPLAAGIPPTTSPIEGLPGAMPPGTFQSLSVAEQGLWTSRLDLRAPADALDAGDRLYSPAMDALLDRFEQTAERVEAISAMSEVDALLSIPAPEDFRVPVPPEPVTDSGADPLERLRRNLDPTA
ncbi:MAG: hypothetical protein KGO50_14775 [Myxococcales bacterium]|nr:hypothetical protein [Myxococcales bacterium]